MEGWKQVAALFAALAVLIISLHIATGARLDRMEARMSAEHASIRVDVAENRRAISELGREVYELRGELKGRDLIAASASEGNR